MEKVLELSRRDKRRSWKVIHKCKHGKPKTRYQNVVVRRSVKDIADALAVAESTVRRVVGRFAGYGEARLIDGREEHGDHMQNVASLAPLYDIVPSGPEAFGWRRPTWLWELLTEMYQETVVRIRIIKRRR